MDIHLYIKHPVDNYKCSYIILVFMSIIKE